MREIYEDVMSYFELIVLDENGKFVSGLTITYELRFSINGLYATGGTMSELTSCYKCGINVTGTGDYYMTFSTPVGYEDGIENIRVIKQPALDSTVAKEAQATLNLATIVGEINDNEALLDIIESGMEDIKTEVNKIQPDIIDAKDDYKADVSGLATEANATINKNEIIGEVNDNEVKLDDIKTEVDKIELIKQMETGKWKIEANQMIFYADDNSTEIARFNLFDSDGNPTMSEVVERRKV